MTPEHDDDPTEYDVLAYEVDFRKVPTHDAKRARIIWLDRPGTMEWKHRAHVATFFLFGYPLEINEVDFDEMRILNSQALLPGRYRGISNIQATVHELEVQNPLDFETFSGFSGSPVFSLEERFCSEPAMRFCGIAIAGTPASGRVFFLEAEVVADLLRVSIQRLEKFGLETIVSWDSAGEL
ncbi:hypothetical protein [Ramlibacter lithotrophicus]|uniref:hypothetical protein n=1 Tax=Ramlibacter lithotrophicus TaxID=2606681 RepID=UPI00143A2969|nr:hypothetical protein [Ramlibacter lithotrophicus]